ncbi:MAG TPA: phospholipase D family protein [Bryobacteraceae bacterium]|nr:phospholipase D family protein [Bryobacteraceae bacterium]
MIFALIAFAGGFAAGNLGSKTGPAHLPQSDANVACYFSPKGGCTDALIEQINAAGQTIEVQAYSFTSKPIGSALVAAARRGVRVSVVLDAGLASENRREASYLAHEGVPVRLDARHAIAHNKVILIDNRTIITGSFNFTHAAEEENAENLLIVHDRPGIQSAYEDNFRVHWAHSDAFTPE